MSNNAWAAFYFGDYIKKTLDLRPVEHGVYLLLLANYYINAAPLPADMKRLETMCSIRTKSERRYLDAILGKFFTRDGDVFRHHRADEEIAKRLAISAKRSEAACKRHANAPANALHLHTQSQSQSQETNTISSPDGEPDLFPTGLDAVLDDIWQHYLTATNRIPKLNAFTPIRKRKGLKRLKECLVKTKGNLENAVKLMKLAIDKIAQSDFHMGRDSKTNGKQFNSWEDNIFRSYEQLEGWWNR
jgi:uncharacterized protein YdaU (DUF1376 family)